MLPLRTDRRTCERYSQGAGIYRIVPAAVGRPTDAASLARLLEWAAAEGLSVVPRGAGSAMDGSSVGSGLVLDLTGLAMRPPVVDRERRLATVDAGVALSRVTEAAAGHGLRFGPDPSSERWATVGGVISTNAAGARSHRLGAVDRWVAGLELVTGEGPLAISRGQSPDPGHPGAGRFRRDAVPLLEAHRDAVLSRAPRTAKDTAGYGLVRYLGSGELLDLVIGSEGTLGVITAATLRLEPIPAHRALLELALPSRDALPEVIATLDRDLPIAIELFDRSFLRFVASRAPDAASAGRWRAAAALLLVEFEDASAARLEARLERVRTAIKPMVDHLVEAREPGAIDALWSLRHQASPLLAGLADGRRSLQVIEDGCVPVAHLPAYLDAIDSACRDAALDAVMFGHAGDGHVHVNLLPDLGRPDWLEAVRAVYVAATGALVRLGGTPAGEHGAGRLRAPILERFVGPEAIACMRAVKRAFDPEGRFNPGVILDDGADPLDRLKVGPAAVAIDPAIAAALHRIEAERGWGASRWDVGEW